ncbi:MAG TPA: hypothetical protein VKU01_04480 [Bryobacteraceae bacterium]|nr:hypothetical protein [Bryobacteraceae bacterium]
MSWFSGFYQSGMSGQTSLRLPNGEDLPLPNPANWNGESAEINVDYSLVRQPNPIRIHYSVVITPLEERDAYTNVLGRVHYGNLTDTMTRMARNSIITRGLRIAFGVGRRTPIGVVASVLESSPTMTDNYIRLIDGDRAFTYVIVG